jgi:hypothetical protein
MGEDNRTGRLIWAFVLSIAGLALLLFNFGLFAVYEPFLQYGLAVLLALAGLVFFGNYISDRKHWWRLIPGWTLLALSVILYLSTVNTIDQRLNAALLFIGQALAFAHIYLLDRSDHWWAIIPGGFMLVLGGVIALSSRTEDPEPLGTLLFIGLGSVFLLLYLLGTKRRLWWALIPGAVLVIFGLLLFSGGDPSAQQIWRWWPLLLILAGGFLAWRAFKQPQRERLSVESAPNLTSYSTAKRGKDISSKARRKLGDYKGPAPGASVEVLPEFDEE